MVNQENFKKATLTKKEHKLYEILIKKIKQWLQQKVASAHSNGVTLGISGGIDSATLAVLANDLFKENAHFYYFKTKVDEYTENHVKLLEKRLGRNIEIVDLSQVYLSLESTLNLKNRMSQSNTKSRLFMTSAYALSQERNTLVLGTDNLDEFYLGYFTKYGDGGCDLLPFANVKKSDVYAMARLLNVPQEIIDKKPSANLYEEQYDEDELGFTYAEFESWLIDKSSVSEEIRNKIIAIHKKTDHKRKAIPRGPKLK
ncbi:NAD(+) synthase [Metamycoplasma neophronis]|uniref:NH(3)-dependent NAD(+) synthetase n=1 Tax=Metamycoplasma neophronis TaxID=872983 RepID=A0ABY2Z4P5_9BACT|nr:NAD(+) synthase [Metamycoplasma neophronis]TPR54092.1 NAD(+) synthase [Metamycoplasma neophronis]